MSARAWRSVDHPRHPANAPGGRGGEFRDKGGGWLAGLSLQIAGVHQLRSDNTLLPPGPLEPDFDLIDEQSFGLFMDALRERYDNRNKPNPWPESMELNHSITTLREQVVRDSADPAYARVILGQQEHMLQVEVNFEKYRLLHAPEMSMDEFKGMLTRKTRREFQSRLVAIRVHSSRLQRMLKRGRLTTLHETGASSGNSNKDMRAEYESAVFGIPKDSPWQDRPVYGYLTDRSSEDEHDNYLDQYGDVRLILKDEARRRSTAMFGDSLGNELASPTPVDDPDWRSWEGNTFHGPGMGPNRSRASKGYIEAQIHGGVTVGDIQEVTFTHEPPPEITDQLDKLGIEWNVDGDLAEYSDYASYDGID